MKHIRSITEILSTTPNGRTIVYMHGYGGYTWQAVRQLKVLKNAGYKIYALDFRKILNSHNPQELLELMDDVDEFLKNKGLINKELLLVGISIGGLVGYNMLRRHKELHKLLVITGGDVSLLPTKRSLKKNWKITRRELAEGWRPVNMYTPAGELKDKNIIMLLPSRDKIINPEEVAEEIKLQQNFNNVRLVRTSGGHYRTIITETILKPKGVLKYLHELEKF